MQTSWKMSVNAIMLVKTSDGKLTLVAILVSLHRRKWKCWSLSQFYHFYFCSDGRSLNEPNLTIHSSASTTDNKDVSFRNVFIVCVSYHMTWFLFHKKIYKIKVALTIKRSKRDEKNLRENTIFVILNILITYERWTHFYPVFFIVLIYSKHRNRKHF